jgi:superfamily II DNA/RNA helicase
VSPTFTDLGVPAPLAASLAGRGIATPFPIQAATIGDLLAGRDVCGRAPTGSGKTLAFGIPLVLRTGKARAHRPRALVLVPTRELAAQVSNELLALGRATHNRPWVETFYGGVGFGRQLDSLRKGTDIAVACPGRLADLVQQGQIHLDEIETVVIDEADRMADMGFLPEVRRLLDRCPTERQTVLFSATLDGAVDVLVSRYQRDPARHELRVDADEVSLAEHHFWSVAREARVQVTADLVDRLGPSIVFCRTKRGADRVARQLGKAGVDAAAIHGDRSQNQRDAALRAFHAGHVAALVATDVAARGIHVDGVAGVVHFDPPADHKDYVHRSGRTARAGRTGVVVSLVVPELDKEVRALQRDLKHPVGLAPVDIGALATGEAPSPGARTLPQAERPPLPDGQRRPSGAARRKAKRSGQQRTPGDWSPPARKAGGVRTPRRSR